MMRTTDSMGRGRLTTGKRGRESSSGGSSSDKSSKKKIFASKIVGKIADESIAKVLVSSSRKKTVSGGYINATI